MEAGVVLITLDDGFLGVLKEVHKVWVCLHECISLGRGKIQNCIKIMSCKLEGIPASPSLSGVLVS